MRLASIALALALAAAPAAAHQPDPSEAEIKVEKIAPGVAVLFGAGGNIGLSYGEDGNVIIDDQFAPLTEKILAAVRTLDPDPVKFVINTHWHGDHTGGNENFGKAGAVIVAHDNVRARMSTEQFSKAFNERTPASPREALPVVTFGDGVNLHLNGDRIRLIHVVNAHTDGDAVVHWEKADVLHMGDTFFNKVTLPFIDLGSGGSIDGMIMAVDMALEIAGPRTKIIPGHGPMAGKADLQAYRNMLMDVREKVAAGIAADQTLDQIKAGGPAKVYEVPNGFINGDQFVEAVYNSIMNPPADGHGHHH